MPNPSPKSSQSNVSSVPDTSSLFSKSNTPSTPAQLSPKKNLGQALVGWLQLDSFRGRLFWMIMAGALTGVGGMAFLFSEMIKFQAEEQVRSTLSGKVNAISSVTKAAETLGYGLGVSATTLHERQAQYADTYRELTLQLFERRPDFVIGLGLGQKENGLIVNQSWLFPYYWVESSATDATDAALPIRYEDLADDEGEFYPESESYKEVFSSRNNIWSEPYQKGPNQLLTYYFRLFSGDGRWLGTTLVDVDTQYLSELINKPVFRGMGYFVLMTRSGNIIADPSKAANNLQTYNEVNDLRDLWEKLDLKGSGFVEGETGYWAYESVPGQDWLVFGFVPYAAVFNRIALITVAATTLMVILLSTAIILAIRSLNRRLMPVLNECKQLGHTEPGLLAQWDQQDELNQLSLAFFNMVERLNLNAETIRRHEQKIEKESLHSDQVSEQFTEFAEALNQEGSEQQTLIREMQRLVDGVANDAQSVDIQLDALNTLGRALNGELSRTLSSEHAAETLLLLEQQLHTLTTALKTETSFQSAEQLQALVAQIMTTIMTLKAYERQRPSADSLWQQTRSLTQAGQAAAVDARSIGASMQTIAPMLNRIEKIAEILVRRAKSVID
ncbi:MAG: Cache domain-containing protein [Cyanobacteria bacterium P01_B01_bin.77]